MSNKVPLRENLLTGRIDGSLIGYRCKSCNHMLPPLTITCQYCFSNDLEQVPLSRRGKLFAFTTNHMNSAHFEAPFYTGYIELPEGFKLFSVLEKVEGKPFKIGMEMEMVVQKLWDKGDDEVIGYKFRPI
jgi:benzoylsuccinyl-CoA thiolase BbsA subunit